VLTKRALVVSTIYLAFSLVGALIISILGFFQYFSSTQLSGLICGTTLALAASSGYYLRRLYRAGISKRLEIVEPGSERMREVYGSFVYLMARTLLASMFGAVACMIVIANFFSAAPPGVEPTSGLIHACALVSFPVGFFSGRVLEHMERSGGQISV
jgi:hypothetical protein